jgi:hypothetical protein
LKDIHEETLKYTNIFEPTLFEIIGLKDYEENCIKYGDKFIVSKEWLSYVFIRNVYKLIKFNVNIDYLTLNAYINTFPEMFVPLKFVIRNNSDKVKIIHFKTIKTCGYLNEIDLDNYYIVPINNLNIKVNKELLILSNEEFEKLLDKLPNEEIHRFKRYLFEMYGSEIINNI